ncbi:MAG: RHS repeat-associated core domain-containing protein, partial [Eubacteriales bacterium]|nr:RHS repeat-associated core domain-containing protein [Eubacteriales bacterium]
MKYLSVVLCICMSISIELGNTMICFADANTSFAESDYAAMFCVSGAVVENGEKKYSNPMEGNDLWNIRDGIMFQLENAETVRMSAKNEGEVFESEDAIYSRSNYSMAASTNKYSGVLVAEKKINISGQTSHMTNAIIYSKNGDINISGDISELQGIFYAPNGNININCRNIRLQGCFICKNVFLNTAAASYERNEDIEKLVDQLEEYILDTHMDLMLYYDDETEKIGIEDIEAQEIKLYTRYHEDTFSLVEDYKNGDQFQPPEVGEYFDAYAEIIDSYGVKKISDIKSFYCEKKEYYSEKKRDLDQDGMQDGYEIRDGCGIPGRCDDDFATQEYAPVMISVEQSEYQDFSHRCGNVLEKVKRIQDAAYLCRYRKQAEDVVQVYYENDVKCVSIYNLNQGKTVFTSRGDEYIMECFDKEDNVTTKLAYEGENQIYDEYSYGEHGVEKITHNDITYHMEYDADGKIKEFRINDDVALDKDWVNAKKCKKTFANGETIVEKYDDKGNCLSISDETGTLFSWEYDTENHDLPCKVKDYMNHKTYEYAYNQEGECTSVQTQDMSYEVDYDGLDWKMRYQDANKSFTEKYHVTEKQRTYQSGKVQEKTEENARTVCFGNTTIYTEKAKTDGKIKKIQTGDARYQYVYNTQDLLTEVWKDGVLQSSYEYNYLKEIVRDNSRDTGKSRCYHYDAGGNILSVETYALSFDDVLEGEPESVETYRYDADFSDQLIQYNHASIRYDEYGNMVQNDRGDKLEWNAMQKLAALKNENHGIRYSYDMDGKRVYKNVDGEEIYYTYAEGNLVHEKRQQEDIWYHYNSLGHLVYMEVNGDTYFYELNDSNDVIGLLDERGKRIAAYHYDIWGNVLSISGDQEIGRQNPYRYRSYYYDEESGLYSLEQRYYDPALKRWSLETLPFLPN